MSPELQQATLTLDKMTGKQAQAQVAKHGFLRIPLDEITNDLDVEQDKYIRIFEPAPDLETEEDEPMNSIVLKVALISPTHMLLVPYSPASVSDGSVGQ